MLWAAGRLALGGSRGPTQLTRSARSPPMGRDNRFKVRQLSHTLIPLTDREVTGVEKSGQATRQADRHFTADAILTDYAVERRHLAGAGALRNPEDSGDRAPQTRR